jgi:hypothetical protein
MGAFSVFLRSSRSDSLAPGLATLGSESDKLACRHHFRETSFLCCQKCGGAFAGAQSRRMRIAVLKNDDPLMPASSQHFQCKSSLKTPHLRAYQATKYCWKQEAPNSEKTRRWSYRRLWRRS